MSAKDQTPGTAQQALFEAFSWVPSQQRGENYELLSNARDIAAGAAITLEMVERAELDAEHDDAPLLSEYHTGALMRMVIASMNLLRDRIDQRFESMNDASPTSPTNPQGEPA